VFSTQKWWLVVLAPLGMVSLAHAHGETVHFFNLGGQHKVGMMAEDGTISMDDDFVPAFVSPGFAWNVTQNAFSTTFPGWSWEQTWLETDWLSFDVLSRLEKWDGLRFVPAPTTATVKLNTSEITVSAPRTSGFKTQIGANDHFHYRYNLDGYGQSSTQANGIYRLFFRAVRWTNSVDAYPPFQMLFPLNANGADLETATAWARMHPIWESRIRNISSAAKQVKPSAQSKAQKS